MYSDNVFSKYSIPLQEIVTIPLDSFDLHLQKKQKLSL